MRPLLPAPPAVVVETIFRSILPVWAMAPEAPALMATTLKERQPSAEEVVAVAPGAVAH
jgi:hypothetical protein